MNISRIKLLLRLMLGPLHFHTNYFLHLLFNHIIEVLIGHAQHKPIPGDPRIVDQDVQASVFTGHAIDERAECLGIADVAGLVFRTSSGLRDLLHQGLQGLFTSRDADHMMSVFSKSGRDGLADTSA